MQTVGVIGAGQMGNGIAHVAAVAGLDVLLLDANPDAVAKAIAIIGKNLDRQVTTGKLASDHAQPPSRESPRWTAMKVWLTPTS